MSRDQQKHSRKPQSIGHSLLLKNFFFFNCPLHPSLSKLALLLFTEKIEVITQEISTSQPPDLRNHLPCTQPPQLPSVPMEEAAKACPRLIPLDSSPPLRSLTHQTGLSQITDPKLYWFLLHLHLLTKQC